MILLSVLAGVGLSLSFAPFSLSFLSFFLFVPIFFAIEDLSEKEAFKIGYIAGLSHFLTLLYWIPYPISKYGHVPVYISIFPYLLLCMYLSLFFGMFCWLCCKKKSSLIFYPACWVATEFLREKLLTGFPWCLLGYSQYKSLHLIQLADIVGIYGISFFIILINTSIYLAIKKEISINNIFLVLALIFLCYGYGEYKLRTPLSYRPIKAAIIQGNIDQSVKWNPIYQAKTIDTYLKLTYSVSKKRASLIVWPETSVPFYFQDGGRFADLIYKASKKRILILGSPAYEKKKDKFFYFNRAYLIANEKAISFYDKVHLVPFGEYVPLKKMLFFINRLVPAAGDFSPGKGIFPLRYKNISAGLMICYEVIFPEIARTHVKNGANILVNMSNDAWFGRTSAPYQHLSMAVLRAVENRRFLIRATNTGISAFIDPCGRIITKSKIFKKQVLIANVGLVNNHKTIYCKYGDFFAYLNLLYIILVLVKHKMGYNLSHSF